MQFVCEDCEDTGEVPDLVWNEDAKEWVADGTRPCHCQLNPNEDD